MVKTIFETLNYGNEILKKSNIDSFLIDAKVLLCHILNCDKNYLLIHKNDIIDNDKYLKYVELIKKRAKKMPVKYITGGCEFYSLEFMVDENVLIPRPDTETIIDKALDELNKENKISILDLCSGSGCIGITLATIFKNSLVTLVDVSEGAINVANKNVLKHDAEKQISIIKKDILNEEISGTFDLIVSNPPYINENDYFNLEEDVKNYEPKIALVSPADEYKFYKRIINTYSANLKNGGIMLLEMGYNQWEYLYEYAKKSSIFKTIEIAKDLSGNNRVLCLKK